MTISSSTSKAQYTGNAATTIFPFNFIIPTSQDLQVYLDNVLQSSGYTASGIGNPAGGSVTFTTAPATGVIVSILRVMPITQTVDYVPYDAFPAQTHEGALDKTAMIDQQLQEQVDRALKLDVNVPAGTVVIDTPVDEAILTWETGTPGVYRVKTGPSAASIQGNVDAAAASAASAAGSASSASAAASAAADSAQAAEEAANNLVANKYEETLTVAKSVFTIPFAISTTSPNVMVMVNGVVQSPSAYTLTNSTTITMSETLPIGTNFFVAAAAPPTLPNFTDIVRVSAPATLGQDLIFNGTLWTPTQPRHKNFFINGGMMVAQRATETPASNIYKYGGADRWQTILGGTSVSGVIAQAPGGSLPNAPVSGLAHGLTSFSLTSGAAAIAQRIEAANAIFLNGKTITISMKILHTFGSPTNFFIGVYKPTAKDNFASMTEVGTSGNTLVSDTTWTTITYTLKLGSSDAINGLHVYVSHASGTFSIKQLYIGDAQLEIGSVATPLEFRPIGEELALCQRYYEKSYDMDKYAGFTSTAGAMIIIPAATIIDLPVIYKVRKRIAPANPTIYSPGTGAAGFVFRPGNSTDLAAAPIYSGENGFCIEAGGATAEQSYTAQWVVSVEL
jgi:hypothetical protein